MRKARFELYVIIVTTYFKYDRGLKVKVKKKLK